MGVVWKMPVRAVQSWTTRKATMQGGLHEPAAEKVWTLLALPQCTYVAPQLTWQALEPSLGLVVFKVQGWGVKC